MSRNLEEYTVPQLRAMAKSLGLVGYSKMRKADVIQLIKKSKKSPKKVTPKKVTPKKVTPKKVTPKKVSKSPKKCPSDKVLNPKTGKCVLKSGRIGKTLVGKPVVQVANEHVANKPVPVSVGIPSDFKSLVEECSQKEWDVKQAIGEGEYGSVYIACKVNNCDYVLKVQKLNEDFNAELQAMTELQGTGIVPKLYAAWKCKRKGYLVMEKMYECSNKNTENAYTDVKKLLDKLYKLGWLHVDTHIGNVMCSKDGKYYLIDFGWAVKHNKTLQYPKHPLSKEYRKIVTWDILKVIQDYNFNRNFNPYATNPLVGPLITDKKYEIAYNDAIAEFDKVDMLLNKK